LSWELRIREKRHYTCSELWTNHSELPAASLRWYYPGQVVRVSTDGHRGTLSPY